MKYTILVYTFLFIQTFTTGQNENAVPQAYYDNIEKADSLYDLKEYKNAAIAYSEAFKADGWKGSMTDRFQSAYSWALAGIPDSAIYQLDILATKAKYSDLCYLLIIPELKSLHNTEPWNNLLKKVKQNKELEEEGLNKALIAQLDSIYIEDQQYRLALENVKEKYGANSEESKELYQKIRYADSVNVLKITEIIDKYGWLGTEDVGKNGTLTLFLVIKHSGFYTQQKYLPILKEAVRNKKADASSLALLEDNVHLTKTGKQIYGSQVTLVSGMMYIFPLEDPENVDKLRAEAGLHPLEEYLEEWDLKWDINQYYRIYPKKSQEATSEENEQTVSFIIYISTGLIAGVILMITLYFIRRRRKY
jgi:hypothetical protein